MEFRKVQCSGFFWYSSFHSAVSFVDKRILPHLRTMTQELQDKMKQFITLSISVRWSQSAICCNLRLPFVYRATNKLDYDGGEYINSWQNRSAENDKLVKVIIRVRGLRITLLSSKGHFAIRLIPWLVMIKSFQKSFTT